MKFKELVELSNHILIKELAKDLKRCFFLKKTYKGTAGMY
jgi:hypothetical protein